MARILSPICITIDRLEELAKDKGICKFIENKFGGLDLCRKTILSKFILFNNEILVIQQLFLVADFFRFAFDGSGADNFYDAGSCIDGRLTSAWNCKTKKKTFFSFSSTHSFSIIGCSQIEKKPYFPVFLLTVKYL